MLNELFRVSNSDIFEDGSVVPNLNTIDKKYIFSNCTHFVHPKIIIDISKKIKNQKTIKALIDLEAETLIFAHTSKAINKNTRTSIQIGKNKHIEPGPFGIYTNHSCEPNAVISSNYNELIDTGTIALITLKKVKKGEELTFDYATTESSVTPSAKLGQCLCGSITCRGKIKGFNELKESERRLLLNSGLVSDYLKETNREPLIIQKGCTKLPA